MGVGRMSVAVRWAGWGGCKTACISEVTVINDSSMSILFQGDTGEPGLPGTKGTRVSRVAAHS